MFEQWMWRLHFEVRFDNRYYATVVCSDLVVDREAPYSRTHKSLLLSRSGRVEQQVLVLEEPAIRLVAVTPTVADKPCGFANPIDI